ncbi:MAG: pyridoxal-phosphate dependent enzyme [Dehalococcoidia bacterium]|nr:pyridoxal-phosphate dependent enzyme [Dehalococcoidia bacterium]
MPEPLPISFADVQAAARRLDGVANRTPVLTSRTLDGMVGNGTRVYFKAENLQRVGAFKFRGAYNHLASLPVDARERGVVAASSGNHAQGVALAAQILGIPATILMPTDAPALKLAATRGYGATVQFFDRLVQTPEAAVNAVREATGAYLVPSFDDPLIMAGQGTAAMELIHEVGELDLVLTPLGGGGLLSGTATAVRALSPGARILGVEPEGADDWVRSLAAGERIMIDPPTTIADGVRTRRPGVLTYAVVSSLADGAVTVTDDQILEAMRFMVLRMKTLVEPTGAIPAAALLSGATGPVDGLRVGVIISGGNVDPDVLCDILNG